MSLIKPRNLYLSVYHPTAVLKCQVNNASAAKGDRLITFDGTTVGSYLNVKSGMTLYVSEFAYRDNNEYGFEKGSVRVKSITSTTITVAANSHINWADNDLLTVVSFFEIAPIYPRIIQDPADATKTLWYKDYDIEYSNQNTVLGSFICMGSHYAGFTGDQVYYSASGSSNLKGEALSYFWDIEGATVTGSNANTPGYFTYNTPGHYTTTLIVSGTSSSDVSYRHVSIYDRIGEGSSTPILNWELKDLTGSRSQGGYTASIRVSQDINETQLRGGDLVILFSDDWYGDLTTRQSIGGNALNRSSIFFVGYVLSGSISYNYRDSYIEFDVGSATEMMKLTEGFSISVRDGDPTVLTEDDPSGWVVVLDMDIRRALYHYLRWHSTVLNCCDFQFKGDDRRIQYFDADRSSLFDAVNTIMSGAFIGKIVTDRQGKVWAERDVWVEPTIYETGFTIAKQDWIGDPQIEETSIDKVSFLEMGGTSYDGNTFAPLIASAPGSWPGYRGKIERVQGLALDSQAELNQITGDVFAQMNVKYSSVELAMAGSYRTFDIAPQEKYAITVNKSDSVRVVDFTGLTFYPETLRHSFDSRAERLMTTITFQQIASGNGADAETITIPVEPVEDSSDYTVPGISLPPINYPPFPGSSNRFGWSFVMGDGTNVIGTGIIGMIEVPARCMITSVKLVSTIAGSIVLDLWRCSYSQIDTLLHPVEADSIIGVLGAKPTLSSGYKSTTSLMNWATLNLNLGDWFYVIVESSDLSLATLAVSGVAYP